MVIVAGFALQKLTSTDVRTISNAILYVFEPCLIFTSIVGSFLESSEWFSISLAACASTLALIGVSWTMAKALQLDKESTSAMVLSTSFVNAGNYGLPVSLFAFGERGLQLAIVFFIMTNLFLITMAVFIASGSNRGFNEAVRSIFGLPLIYALVVSIAVRLSGFAVPQPVFQSVNLMAQAAIPTMLVALGMELARSTFKKSNMAKLKPASISTVIKLIFPMLFVTLFSELIGLEGLARKVTLVEASMPTAVLTAIIAVRFGGDSRLVTTSIVLSTLGSIITLTLLLSFLT